VGSEMCIRDRDPVETEGVRTSGLLGSAVPVVVEEKEPRPDPMMRTVEVIRRVSKESLTF